jgi:hypothetical protein
MPGGDWYDIFELDARRVGLVVGDVTGHGVKAAAAMGRLRVAVLAHALGGLGPSEVIERVDTLLDQLATSEVATMVYVVADPGRGKLIVANAGHPPPPIIIEPDGTVRRVDLAHERLLGVRPPLTRRRQEVTNISSGGHLRHPSRLQRPQLGRIAGPATPASRRRPSAPGNKRVTPPPAGAATGSARTGPGAFR